jgi:hypothetical protein
LEEAEMAIFLRLDELQDPKMWSFSLSPLDFSKIRSNY